MKSHKRPTNTTMKSFHTNDRSNKVLLRSPVILVFLSPFKSFFKAPVVRLQNSILLSFRPSQDIQSLAIPSIPFVTLIPRPKSRFTLSANPPNNFSPSNVNSFNTTSSINTNIPLNHPLLHPHLLHRSHRHHRHHHRFRPHRLRRHRDRTMVWEGGRIVATDVRQSFCRRHSKFWDVWQRMEPFDRLFWREDSFRRSSATTCIKDRIKTKRRLVVFSSNSSVTIILLPTVFFQRSQTRSNIVWPTTRLLISASRFDQR